MVKDFPDYAVAFHGAGYWEATRESHGPASQVAVFVRKLQVLSEKEADSVRAQQAGPDGYPRVLDYSTFEFTTLPYSKNVTTRSSSPVVTISSFCPIIQIFGMGRHHSFLDNGRHVSNDVVA